VIGEAAICEDGRSRIIPRADHSGQGVVTENTCDFNPRVIQSLGSIDRGIRHRGYLSRQFRIRRGDKRYDEIYTTKTIKGQCANVDKILVIGHEDKGKFETATIDKVANAIFKSGISLTGSKKVAFDTCYAGYSDPTANVTSALYEVGLRLKAKNNACNLELVGATGPAVTIGALGYSVSFPLVGGIDLSVLGGNPTSDWSSRIPGSDMQVACRTRRRSFTKWSSTSIARTVVLDEHRKDCGPRRASQGLG
jgi:hypothetical protein